MIDIATTQVVLKGSNNDNDVKIKYNYNLRKSK